VLASSLLWSELRVEGKTNLSLNKVVFVGALVIQVAVPLSADHGRKGERLGGEVYMATTLLLVGRGGVEEHHIVLCFDLAQVRYPMGKSSSSASLARRGDRKEGEDGAVALSSGYQALLEGCYFDERNHADGIQASTIHYHQGNDLSTSMKEAMFRATR
jgi:hypothetical protein